MWRSAAGRISSSTLAEVCSRQRPMSRSSCAPWPVLPKAEPAVREIVLDTETTGLSPADGHRVLEIGAIELLHQTPTGRVFHALINPERDVPEEAVRVHGHTAAGLKEKPVFAGVIDELLAFI